MSDSNEHSKSDALPSLKSASGGGFDFEDQVCAVLLVEMLLGRPPLSVESGVVEKLERQATDWEPFGDILLTLETNAGERRTVGCSVKSNRPIRARGATEEFVKDAWTVLNLPVFQRGTDKVAVFTAPLAEKAIDRLNQLVRQARATDSQRLKEKIPHDELQAFHDSFKPPIESALNANPGDLLRILHHRQFDFQTESSRSTAESIARCHDILREESANAKMAEALWDALLKISRNLRISGGNETRSSLSGRLRHAFPLRDDPADVAEWAAIRRLSESWKREISTQLAGGMQLPRTEEIESIQQIASSSGGFHILGSSGSGKSALVKLWTQTVSNDGSEVIWIKADKFAELLRSVPSFQSVVGRVRKHRALLIFDGIEACTTKAEFDSIARTISQVSEGDNCPWKIIATCQSQEWFRASSFLVGQLGNSDVLLFGHTCGPLAKNDSTLVCEHYPAVKSLAQKPHLRDFILSPKVLDIIARGQLSESVEIACEADLVDWWWREAVQCGRPIAAEERLARILAAKMADELTTELSPDSLDDDAAASALINRQILRRNQDGRIRFDHELLADWSRSKHLRSIGPDLINFMGEHSENPPWLRAIRILSQHFIEREGDLGAWRDVAMKCVANQDKPSERNSRDLVAVLDAWLDGIAFCSDIPKALEELESDLLANDCRLLRRLIHRVFSVATIPHPKFRNTASKTNAELFKLLQRELRLPVWSVWTHFVGFLLKHRKEALEHLAVTIADMADFANLLGNCLENRIDFWKDLGFLTIENAEIELQRETAGINRYDDTPWKKRDRRDGRQHIYAGALLAAPHDPDRVARLVLKAAGRLEWGPGEIDAIADPEWKGSWWERGSSIFGGVTTLHDDPESWQDGPTRRTSDDFATAYIKKSGCLSLYHLRPDSAMEALLGFLIDWPKLQPDRHGGLIESRNHGFQYRDWSESSAFYANGPFLFLLTLEFQPAARAIIRLVNFATERYVDWWPYENKATTFEFNAAFGRVALCGNDQVYNWGRIAMNTPEFVSSALMAIEKYLEMKIEKDEDISDCIDLILREGKSLAFAGVFVSLGKRHPDLFAGILSPLLFERQIFMFDEHAIMEETAASMGDWNEPVWKAKQRREWNELPERRQRLLQICCTLMLNGHDIATTLSEVRQLWQDQAAELASDDEQKLILLRWASNFDPATWQEIKLSNGGVGWQQVRPQELRDVESEEQHLWQQHLMMIPFRCRELLEKRTDFQSDTAREIWAILKDFKERAAKSDKLEDDDWASMFRDHRHAQAGLCAVLLCLCRDWLESDDNVRREVMSEVRGLLGDRPFVNAFTPEDNHIDGESFLARCVIQCLSYDLKNRYWRSAVGQFVASYRYRTVQTLFNEAHLIRNCLGDFVVELEALALSFAAARHRAETPRRNGNSKSPWFETFRQMFVSLFRQSERDRYRSSYLNPDPKILEKWCAKWLPRFARRRGPVMPEHWDVYSEANVAIDQTDADSEEYGRAKRGRRDYGLDTGILLAVFGHYPALGDAINDAERDRWIASERELLSIFLRTLPQVDHSDESEWSYNLYEADRTILKIVAKRVFEGGQASADDFTRSVVELPPQAHQYVSQFFTSLLLQALAHEPPDMERLLELWRKIGEHYLRSGHHCDFKRRDCIELWRGFLFFGNFSSSIRDACFAPFVEGISDYYEFVVSKLGKASHDHVELVSIFCSEGGRRLLVKSLEWFLPIWKAAGDYYWSVASERSVHEMYLDEAWKNHFPVIKANPESLQAFKILTLKLAKHRSLVALEIQNQLGTS